MRGLGLVVVLTSGLAAAAPAAPPGGRKPEPWVAHCAGRLEKARAALGLRDGLFVAQPPLALATIDQHAHEVVLRAGTYTMRVTFRLDEAAPVDAGEEAWSDRLLDTKNAQRLLRRHVVRGSRGLAAELALDPAATEAEAFVRILRRAIDACANELPAAKAR